MEISKKIKLLKYLIYVYVVILGATGCGQIALGATLLWDHIAFKQLVENEFWQPAAALLAIGFFSLLLCILVVKATAKKKKTCSMSCFTTLLLLSVVGQLCLGAWALLLRRSLLHSRSELFQSSLYQSFDVFYIYRLDQAHIWNRVQEEYQCCGVSGPNDYRIGSAIPWSCFHRDGGGTEAETAPTTLRTNEIGCLDLLTRLLRRHLLYTAFGTLITALLQCTGVFCTIKFVMLRRKEEDCIKKSSATTPIAKNYMHDLERTLAERNSTRRSNKRYHDESSKLEDIS